MSAHTPGPWVIQDNYGADESGGSLLIQNRPGSPFVVVNPEGDGIGCVEANAYLIAAAPELLKACEEMMSAIEALRASGVAVVRTDAWRAAIAKARGGK